MKKLISRTKEKDGKFDITIRNPKGEIISCVEVFSWAMSNYTKEKYRKYFKEEVLERVKDIDDRARIIEAINTFEF